MWNMNDEWKRALDHPDPPDDPDAESEFEEIVFVENGKRLVVRRPNPRFVKAGRSALSKKQTLPQ